MGASATRRNIMSSATCRSHDPPHRPGQPAALPVLRGRACAGAAEIVLISVGRKSGASSAVLGPQGRRRITLSGCSRSVRPVYSLRNTPRFCSSGTTPRENCSNISRRRRRRQHEAVAGFCLEQIGELVGDHFGRADQLRAELAGGEAAGCLAEGQALRLGALEDDVRTNPASLPRAPRRSAAARDPASTGRSRYGRRSAPCRAAYRPGC